MEVVAIDVGDPSFEQLAKAGVRVFANRDQEVSAKTRPVNAAGELVGEPARDRLAKAVEEVLLELVEHNEQARIRHTRSCFDGGVEAVGGQLWLRASCQVRLDRRADFAR